MKLKIFTLRLDPATGKFDDRELTEFQMGKDVIELSEHFLLHEKTPTLTLVLRYRELPDAAHPSAEAARKDWRAELDADGKRMYDKLRLWRGRKAKHEGIPPYLILNNRELAELAMKRPASLTKLREIDGIGEAKSARWGEEMLALLAKLAAVDQTGEKPASTQSAGGGGVAHGFRRASPLRPLGNNTQGYFVPYQEISQTGSLHPLLAHR